jgi:hypothetical protein
LPLFVELFGASGCASGVGQPAVITQSIRLLRRPFNDWSPFHLLTSPPRSAPVEFGDGHPVQPLPDVRGADARSAQIRRPDGVTLSFQVIVYKVKPGKGKRARNLLSSKNWRAALADEAEELGPEVALVVEAFASPGDAEPLAGTASGPDWTLV